MLGHLLLWRLIRRSRIAPFEITRALPMLADRAPRDDRHTAKTPTIQERIAVLEKLARRGSELWKEMQKDLIVVNGQPTNLEAIQQRCRNELAKFRNQIKAEWAATYPDNDPFAPLMLNDPSLSHEDRARVLNYEMAGIKADRAAIESRLVQLKEQADKSHLTPEEQKVISILNARLAVTEVANRSLAAEARDADKPAEPRPEAPKASHSTARPPEEIHRHVDPPVSPRAATPAPAPAESRVAGVQLDVVNLANTTVDAWGALRLAQAKYTRLAKLRDTSVVSAEELEIAKVNYETATRRLDILKAIAHVALESAEEDLKRVKTLSDRGLPASESILQAEGKARMLKANQLNGRPSDSPRTNRRTSYSRPLSNASAARRNSNRTAR